MSEENWEQFDEIFGLPQNSLEAECKIKKELIDDGWIEITLNYPRTANFKRLIPEWQKELYKNLFLLIIKNFCSIIIGSIDDYYFEVCQSGYYHLHGKFRVNGKFNRYGLVEDIVKKYLEQLPKRYNKYEESKFYLAYCRYRCPSITCQFVSTDKVSRVQAWEEYIKKSQ